MCKPIAEGLFDPNAPSPLVGVGLLEPFHVKAWNGFYYVMFIYFYFTTEAMT